MKTNPFPAHAPALIVLALVAFSGCQRASSGPTKAPAPVAVQTVLPQRGPIARYAVLAADRILPYQESTLYAKVSGYLKDLYVDKGDRVRAGQMLGRIEVPELLADAAEYKAEADVAATNYARLLAARKRAPDLVVPQTVDDLWGQWKVAQAKLRRTRTLLRYARLTAPFAGVVTARFVDPGAFIPAATSGTPVRNAAVVTLMDYSRLRVQVFVPEPLVPFITNGLPVQLTVDELPGRVFDGRVTRFAYALDPATKTMLTEIVLPNPTGDLRPGMYASVRLQIQHKSNALLLPTAAVSVGKAGSSVFRVVDGKAKQCPVKTGFSDSVNLEITSGLQPDQPVVLLGTSPVTDGESVAPVLSK